MYSDLMEVANKGVFEGLLLVFAVFVCGSMIDFMSTTDNNVQI